MTYKYTSLFPIAARRKKDAGACVTWRQNRGAACGILRRSEHPPHLNVVRECNWQRIRLTLLCSGGLRRSGVDVGHNAARITRCVGAVDCSPAGA